MVNLDPMALSAPMMPDFSGGPFVFLKEVRSELAKVIWPNREEVTKLTSVVIVLSIVIGLYIGGLDFFLTKLTDVLVK